MLVHQAYVRGGVGESGGRYLVPDAGVEGGVAVWRVGHVGGECGGGEDGRGGEGGSGAVGEVGEGVAWGV